MVNVGMNRYENGKIYKITDVGYNKCYIGSTCESLSKRMERHRKQYKEYIKGRMKKKTTAIDIFNEFGIENCTIELIENYPCQSKEELFKREGGHIKATECVNRQNRLQVGRNRSGNWTIQSKRENTMKEARHVPEHTITNIKRK